jgi:DNA polymerase-1
MTLINNVTKPSALIVGAPNLCRNTQMASLVRHYTVKLTGDTTRRIAFGSIQVDQNSKYLKKYFTEDVDGIIAYCESNGVKVIGVTNPKFYQFATGDKQFMANIGKAMMGVGALDEYIIVPLLNYFMLLAKPEVQGVLDKGVDTLDSVLQGTYDFNTESLVDRVKYTLITTAEESKKVLANLMYVDKLTMDIETTGLVMGKDRIITISLSPDTTTSYVFATCQEYTSDAQEVRKALAVFFRGYKGKHIWHNAMFDIPFILRDVLRIPFTNQKLINSTINSMDIEDTMHIVYLAKNSTSRESYKLKELIYDKYGEYDKDIEQDNLLAYTFEEVGKYNALDTTATMEVYEEYYPKMALNGQEDLFNSYYKVSLKTLLKVKYRGVNVDVTATAKAKAELEELVARDTAILMNNQHIKDVEYNLNINAVYKYNSTHKKQKSVEDFSLKFNPGSSAQKAMLLFDVMGLPVLETTKTGNPSTGKDVIKQHIAGMKEGKEEDATILQLLLDVSEASKVANTFLKAFEELSVEAEDGTYRIHGDYKLTGTVSGRLSSANPNLQNLPSNSKYGKLIKGLFPAPEGFIFAGSDYNALETRVAAIISKDEALRKILLEGYDSHALYAAVYFADELQERGLPYGPDITAEESLIIKEEASDLRQEGKSVTFALQYGGTHMTVSKSLGVSKQRAEEIVASYHALHGGVTDYYRKKTEEAEDTGYYTIETGLRLKAPGLQSLDETVVEKTVRSATNALFQGFGTLTIDSMNAFQAKIEEEGMDSKVQMVNTIHDAIYQYVDEDPEIIKWTNDTLMSIMCKDFVADQSIPLLANLDIGKDWKHQTEIANNCEVDEIIAVLNNDEGEGAGDE